MDFKATISIEIQAESFGELVEIQMKILRLANAGIRDGHLGETETHTGWESENTKSRGPLPNGIVNPTHRVVKTRQRK